MPTNLQTINLETLALLSAALIPAAPYVTAFLTQSHLPKWANALIAWLVCLAAGLIAFWQAGGSFTSIHNMAALYAAVGVIFTGAKLFYVKLGYQDPIILSLKRWGLALHPPKEALPVFDPNRTQQMNRDSFGMPLIATVPPPTTEAAPSTLAPQNTASSVLPAPADNSAAMTPAPAAAPVIIVPEPAPPVSTDAASAPAEPVAEAAPDPAGTEETKPGPVAQALGIVGGVVSNLLHPSAETEKPDATDSETPASSGAVPAEGVEGD